MILPSLMLAYKYFQEDFANEIQIIIPASRIAFKHLDQKDDKNIHPRLLPSGRRAAIWEKKKEDKF